jgi:hypothetical protein
MICDRRVLLLVSLADCPKSLLVVSIPLVCNCLICINLLHSKRELVTLNLIEVVIILGVHIIIYYYVYLLLQFQ